MARPIKETPILYGETEWLSRRLCTFAPFFQYESH